MHWVIPLKYRHNPQLIRNYLFFGSRQNKVLLDADGLWSDCNEEVEAYRGDRELLVKGIDLCDLTSDPFPLI